jgi:hypothetical protein
MSLYLNEEIKKIPKSELEDHEFSLIAQSNENEFIFLDSKDCDGPQSIYVEDDNITFKPVPRVKEDERECVLIVGKSGSGKSTFTRNYAEQYSKMFPDSNIYLFSKVNEDKALDDLDNLIRIKMDRWTLEQHGALEAYSNSLVIFDDIDQMYNEYHKEQIKKFRNSILEEGRKLYIYCVVTTHQFPAKKEKILNIECRAIVLFPKYNKAEINEYLKNQLLLKKRKRDRILDTASRWIMFINETPEYCITEKEIYLISD